MILQESVPRPMEELRNMFLVVGNCDERFREGFIKYFPKYFKAAQNG
jgi:hypothetical protein